MPMGEPMPDDRFWSIIEATARHKADRAAQLKALRDALQDLLPDDVVAFHAAFARHVASAYSWDLWGAAYVIHGGAGDDAFEYFRRWLVAQGKSTFLRAAADPDSLAELLADDQEEPLDFEEFGYVAGDVWAKKVRRNPADIDGFYDGKWARVPPDPVGAPFEEDPQALAQRYPKLWKRFGESPLG
jgi:hypothetical protein